MSTILDTIVSYEDKAVDLVKKAQAPVAEYVAKGVDLVGDRLPDVTYPSALPTPFEVVDTQTAFAKKMIDANASIATAVFEKLAPVAGYAKPKVVRKAA